MSHWLFLFYGKHLIRLFQGIVHQARVRVLGFMALGLCRPKVPVLLYGVPRCHTTHVQIVYSAVRTLCSTLQEGFATDIIVMDTDR